MTLGKSHRRASVSSFAKSKVGLDESKVLLTLLVWGLVGTASGEAGGVGERFVGVTWAPALTAPLSHFCDSLGRPCHLFLRMLRVKSRGPVDGQTRVLMLALSSY